MADARIFTVVSDTRTFVVLPTTMASFFTIKDPSAVLDYYIDWTSWLTGTDAIATSTWTCTSTAITISTATAHGTATTTVWLTGGSDGEVYDVTNHVVTSASRTEDRTIQFTVLQR